MAPLGRDELVEPAPRRRHGLVPVSVARTVRVCVNWLPRGQSLSEDVWRVRHRTLSYLLRAHVVAIFAFALVRGYSFQAACMYAGVIAVFAMLSSTDQRCRGFVSAMNAVGLVTCSAVLVDLSGGVIEMHFHFFVMVGILTLYQDWLPFLFAIGFVVLHHGVLGTLDPKAVYDHQSAINDPFLWALIHGAFVLAASAASVVAWRLNEEQAFHDALTRLPNRALFQDRVAHALARADRRPSVLAVLFIDLDGFKDVNDSLGHAAGDQLLVKVAERLRGCVRPADTAARLGGDEFAVLVEDLSGPDDAAAVAERVLDSLSVPFRVGSSDVTVGASIGIALNARSETVDSLLRAADVAMYSVKTSGRARYEFYATEMLTSVVDRVELGHSLRKAVDADEFVLHYQPIVSLETGSILGVEALVRWQHPTKGLLAPSAFIDIAEETGLIVPIGRWVLETACAQAATWKARYPDVPLRMSVNLSPVQVFQAGLLDIVSGALAHSGLTPSDLALELTEAVLVKDTELAAHRLRQLKTIGVRLAIDDFGTGYSSLNYLMHLPFDVLKIDKGFIDGISEGPRESGPARAIITLAHSFDMTTVAEGIERPEQAEALRQLGCRYAQGFLFSKPLCADELDTYLASAYGVTPAAVRP